MNDLISREAAYDVLTEYYHHRTNMQHEALKDALARVPSAEPHWTLCKDAQPKEYDTNYLITTDTHVIGIAKYYEDGAWVGVDANGDWLAEWDIMAWMPLPEPWEGVE